MSNPLPPAPPVLRDGVRTPRVDGWLIERRIAYLSELRGMLKEARGHGRSAIEPIEVRITQVCDSIEKDLGLKSSSVGELTLKVDVDTSSVKERFKEISDMLEKIKQQNLHQGGIVDGNHLSKVGDHGRELIVPLSSLGSGSGFALHFDNPPALVFVSEKGGRHAKVYQDGKQLKGVKSITIRAAVDEATTHEIEYMTGYTAEKGEA